MAVDTPNDSYLGRAVRVLEAFAAGDGALGVSEIARRSGLHVATASRIIAGLVDTGLLEREPDRRCRTGVRLWELGLRASPTLALRNAALPVMEDLHAVVRQHVQISVRRGTEVLFVDRLSAPDAVVPRSRIAGRLPLHVSSSGQVLLAYGPAQLQSALMTARLTRYTDRTITDPHQLRETLGEIRHRGYAHCRGHLDESAQSFAAPITVPQAGVVASLSMVMPATSPMLGLVPALLTAARTISRALLPAKPQLGAAAEAACPESRTSDLRGF